MEELLREALVIEEEQPYEIPNNWVWTKLGELGELKGRIGWRGYTKSDLRESGPLVLGAAQINKKDEVDLSNPVHISIEKFKESPEIQVNIGDILIVKTGASIGKIALIKEQIGDACINPNVALLKNIRINNFYLALYMQTRHFKNALWDKVNSSAQPAINQASIKTTSIPVPPVNEQKRIAEKVERLLSKIEEAKQLIEEAKETFELRRAAILDKAFRGELTRKWRGENADITTANEWIEQINLLKEGTKTKYKDQLDSSILEKLYKLPKEWKWVRLNDLIEASTYGTSAKTNDDVTGTPVLRMGNIVDGYLELNNLKYLPNNHEDVLKYDLQTNDLLFNRTNSYELVGKTSVITEDVSERFTFASYLIRVRLFYKDFLASYVSHYINSHVGRKILLSMVTQQVGQANINSQKLASLPIPLPSQEEVMEITNWLNNYRELESKQKEMILVEENIEALKQSILFKAFRGELGTNDPGEESAIELLKEVLQEQVK
ncbi:restriction endonuclease subunit S [Bacillus sp. 204(2023)]|uniref:restriction endonuclease subunit S n=1 Tax=Bacillus sp. 204(2023) TaxID=3096766 RepID=UPI003FA58A8E